MKTSHIIRAMFALGALSCPASARAQAPSCETCVKARFWEVSPDFWNVNSAAPFTPEQANADLMKKADVGVAFSGGGTRSASATIGQLRALDHLGWLSRIRYMTAVSGGSWAAVPFTYYQKSLTDLLGTEGPLDPLTIERVSNGFLARRVVRSKLGHLGLQETPSFLPNAVNKRNFSDVRSALQTARKGIRTVRGHNIPDPNRQDKTYAHALGQIFLEGLVTSAGALSKNVAWRTYSWNQETVDEMTTATGRPASDFLVPRYDRPFLIVGGTAVKPTTTGYPRLIPVEYTPLYTGVRQRFGSIGGTYLWPWAYDRLYAAPFSADYVLVGPGPRDRIFTLADVIASSGAAPQLELLLGDALPDRLRPTARQLSLVFPSFANLAVRAGTPNAPTVGVAHGDGGFSDNLGIMPLLVRQVKNIIVFVNSSSHYTENDQLQSYFMPIAIRDGGGDKTMNAVFDPKHYRDVLAGFDQSTAAGGGAIYCATGWDVKKNEIYNSAAYNGLNICWIYNYPAEQWKNGWANSIKDWLAPPAGVKPGKQAKQLVHFPYYATFGENKPYVIKLKPLQVNLLADLASWSVSNKAAVDKIVKSFGGVLPQPAPGVIRQ